MGQLIVLHRKIEGPGNVYMKKNRTWNLNQPEGMEAFATKDPSREKSWKCRIPARCWRLPERRGGWISWEERLQFCHKDQVKNIKGRLSTALNYPLATTLVPSYRIEGLWQFGRRVYKANSTKTKVSEPMTLCLFVTVECICCCMMQWCLSMCPSFSF